MAEGEVKSTRRSAEEYIHDRRNPMTWLYWIVLPQVVLLDALWVLYFMGIIE